MLSILGPIIQPLTALLVLLTGVLHSYGLAIIVFTLLVRVVITPLVLRQMRSQKKMAALAPRLKEIQQRYAGNAREMVEAQRKLYQEEGVSPFGSLLPTLIQAPLLIALFFVFQNLAHPQMPAIFHQLFLWFRLDRPDHLFGAFGPLSILSGAAQWMLQRMTIQPAGDPTTHVVQQVLQVLPLALIVVAARYPAGLVLYWVVSTLYGIALQLWVSGTGQLFRSPFRLAEATAGNAAASLVSSNQGETPIRAEGGTGSVPRSNPRRRKRSAKRRGRSRP